MNLLTSVLLNGRSGRIRTCIDGLMRPMSGLYSTLHVSTSGVIRTLNSSDSYRKGLSRLAVPICIIHRGSYWFGDEVICWFDDVITKLSNLQNLSRLQWDHQIKKVGVEGFEPSTLRLKVGCSKPTKLHTHLILIWRFMNLVIWRWFSN